SVTDEGDFILFVDTTYNLRIIGCDGQDETPLSTSGTIWSIAFSPNGEKLAFTSIYIDTTLYIIDLSDTTGASDKTWKINRIAGLQGSTALMLYADALDWKKDSEYVLYDAINTKVINEQDTTYYWSIYSMRAGDGAAWQVFPSQSEDVSVGNPIYASNNDYIIAFDFVDNSSGQSYVLGANLETSKVGTITNISNSWDLGFPSYSNDDSKIVYQYHDGWQYTIRTVELQNDKISGAGGDYVLAIDGMYPVWFTIGERPVEVEEQEEDQELPSEIVLKQNYPNPFNAETVIEYRLPKPTKVKVNVYNVLGQRVTTLIDQVQPAGYHKTSWDGTNKSGITVSSGVYFYEIQTSEFSECRKMVLLR
ncbi:MAG: FlgD immunoglobulin-like domain containing protein, partial [Candidatus Zixiibacteriota bacterium]